MSPRLYRHRPPDLPPKAARLDIQQAPTRAILCCAGDQRRWGNYLGTPKHLVSVMGTPLLKRTVQQLQGRGIQDIVVVAEDRQYAVEGTSLKVPQNTALDDTGLGHSTAFWSSGGPTLVLFGDVYFSDRTMNEMARCQVDDIHWFGRYGPSLSGCPYGELFGLLVPLEDQERLLTIMSSLRDLATEGKAGRAGGWECYRLLHGIPLKTHVIEHGFHNISDETEDFDFPTDYENWMKVFGKPD